MDRIAERKRSDFWFAGVMNMAAELDDQSVLAELIEVSINRGAQVAPALVETTSFVEWLDGLLPVGLLDELTDGEPSELPETDIQEAVRPITEPVQSMTLGSGSARLL